MNTENKSNINMFRVLRVIKDIKVPELSMKLGVSPKSIYAFEKGTKTPSDEILERYARAFCVKKSFLKAFELDKDNGFEGALVSVLKALYVPIGAYNQVAWERSIAMEQLQSYGVGFAENKELAPVHHAHWISIALGVPYVQCSHCGEMSSMDGASGRFCPNCGAKMDEVNAKSNASE